MSQDLISDLLKQIKFICEVKEEDETTYDKNMKYMINLITKNDPENVVKNFNQESFNLFYKFIGLIYFLNKKNKEERTQIYEDKKLMKDFSGERPSNLCYINFEFKSKEKKILYECLYSFYSMNRENLIKNLTLLLINIAFIIDTEELIKYMIFSLIIKKYLPPIFEHVVPFEANGININETICVEIIQDLLIKKERDLPSICTTIQALLIIKFNTYKYFLVKYDLQKIIEALKRVHERIVADGVISKNLYLEKAIVIFKEELNYSSTDESNYVKKKKKRKSKKNTITVNSLDNSHEERKETKNDNSNTFPIDSGVDDNSIKLYKNNFEKNQIINDNNPEIKNQENNNTKFWDNPKNYIHDLLNKITNMSSDDQLKSYIKELNDCIQKVLDNNNEVIKNISLENKELKKELIQRDNNKAKEIDSLRNDIKKERDVAKKERDEAQKERSFLSQEIKSMKEEMELLKVNVEKLNNKNEKIKDILEKIQTRDMTKNFLKSFYCYLTNNDFKRIRKDFYSKGDIIVLRIKETFSKFGNNKKIDLVLKLIKKSFASLTKGNNFAHSLIMDNFNEDMEKYKDENNLEMIDSTEIFCFLLGLDLSKEDFENAFEFLKEYFDADLYLINENDYDGFLDKYIQ